LLKKYLIEIKFKNYAFKLNCKKNRGQRWIKALQFFEISNLLEFNNTYLNPTLVQILLIFLRVNLMLNFKILPDIDCLAVKTH